MPNAISFTSTYKVHTTSNKKDLKAFNKFEDLCDKKEEKFEVYTKYEDKLNKKYPYDWSAVKTLVVPEYMDSEVEAYCANYGIKFDKLYTYKLLEPESVLSRIEKTPEGYIKANINPEKFFELVKNQNGNIKHCKKDYDKHYEDKINLILKSGDKIPATTLKIASQDMSGEELIHHIETYGKNALYDDSLIIDFIQRTDSPDHCVFFGLNDNGMNPIPVYVDKDTFLILAAFDLLNM